MKNGMRYLEKIDFQKKEKNFIKKENGGGQIFFDDELIMQDGIFVPSDLQELNQNKTLKLTKK